MAELSVLGRCNIGETSGGVEQTPHSAHRGSILFMDDDVDIREVTYELLKQCRFEVALACDGSEAIAIYEKSIADNAVFDVVILDLVVPRGMGARETIVRLQALDPWVKALVASGYSNDYILDNYKEFGFSGTLAKPYNFDDLLNAITALIAEKSRKA